MRRGVLHAAFPNVRQAVAWCETHGVPELFRDKPYSFEQMSELLTHVIDDTMAEDCPVNRETLLLVRELFAMREFGRYLAGRLGWM
jgi:hypothetical protein